MTTPADNRRLRLKLWTETHPIPPAEKSYFSQLLSGTASFGEKAARRLEAKYHMGDMYLDVIYPSDELSSKSSIREQNTPLSQEAEDLILCVRRLDKAGAQARKMFTLHLQLMSVAVSFNQVQHPLTTDEYLDQVLDDVGSRLEPAERKHAHRSKPTGKRSG